MAESSRKISSALPGVGGGGQPGQIAITLPLRAPFCAPALLSFLGDRAIPGVEERRDGMYRRVLSLPGGLGVVELVPAADEVHCTLQLEALSDVDGAVHRCRRLFDLDADSGAVDETLGADPLLRSLVRKRPGLRSPGAVDGFELAVRAILGQQVSVQAARTQAGRIAETLGRTLPAQHGVLARAFPTADAIAGAPDSALPMPRVRRDAIRSLAAAVAAGKLSLDPGADREESVRTLLELRGIGPWTAAYIAMRALGDPDVLLGGDLGVRKAFERLGGAEPLASLAERWRPWRSYATHHLWASLGDPPPSKRRGQTPASED